MTSYPTDEELQALSQPTVRAPGEDLMPDPEPEVLKRAQELLDDANEGKGPAAGQAQPETQTDLTAAQKLSFMAHVLEGTEYHAEFPVLQTTVTFRSPSAREEQLLADAVSEDETQGRVQPGQRKNVYHRYALAMSLSSFDGVRQQVLEGVTDLADLRKRHDQWLAQLTGGQYRVLRLAYDQFTLELNELYRRVDDPDFWPTPLSR